MMLFYNIHREITIPLGENPGGIKIISSGLSLGLLFAFGECETKSFKYIYIYREEMLDWR